LLKKEGFHRIDRINVSMELSRFISESEGRYFETDVIFANPKFRGGKGYR
jgi:hypothetical protein